MLLLHGGSLRRRRHRRWPRLLKAALAPQGRPEHRLRRLQHKRLLLGAWPAGRRRSCCTAAADAAVCRAAGARAICMRNFLLLQQIHQEAVEAVDACATSQSVQVSLECC